MQTAEATPAAAMIDDNVQQGQDTAGGGGGGRGRVEGDVDPPPPSFETSFLSSLVKQEQLHNL